MSSRKVPLLELDLMSRKVTLSFDLPIGDWLNWRNLTNNGFHIILEDRGRYAMHTSSVANHLNEQFNLG